MVLRRSVLVFLCVCLGACGKDWRLDFDEKSYSAVIPRPRANKSVDVKECSLTAGISGRALDLRATAAKRTAVVCYPEHPIAYGKTFSVSMWVRTEPGVNPRGVLASNGYLTDYGWQLEALDGGSWKITLTDGKTVLDYAPPKQKINDGVWHMLAFSVDQNAGAARFYFDGRNVAIYNLQDLKGIRTGGHTFFGGSDWDMVASIDGCIDQLRVIDRVLSSEEISGEFDKLRPGCRPAAKVLQGNRVRCLTWNIWGGGKKTGQVVGPQRIVDMLKDINPDVIGLNETYGSGALLADGLGYQLYLVSSNISILSRYPIKRVMIVYKAFNSGAVEIDLGNGRSFVFTEVWLDWRPDVLFDIAKEKATNKTLHDGEAATRLKEITGILKDLKPCVDHADKTPMLLCGDFNSPSHRDWTEENKDMHHGHWVDWPVTRKMEKAGFVDTFRMLHPDVRKDTAPSWCAWDLRPERIYGDYSLQTRIDFIFLKGGKAVNSRYVADHPIQFPSDHGLFYTDFLLP